MSYGVVFYAVIVRFVNFTESVDHHCLSFPFIAWYYFLYLEYSVRTIHYLFYNL